MDILANRLALGATKENHFEVLQTVIDLLPHPVSIKNGRLERLAVNKAFIDFTGYSAESLLGESKLDIQHADTKKQVGCDKQVLESKTCSKHIEKIVNQNGEHRWVEIQKSYFQANGGEDHVISILTDVSQLKEREFELKASRKRTYERAMQKSRFLANMGHDIRAPLNGIIGMADLLAGTHLDRQQTEAVDLLSRSGDSLMRIIDDIIDYAKIDAEKMKINPIAFNLRDVIEDFAETLGPTARDKRLDLIVSISPTLPTHLIGDTLRIRQILMNLIENALKFTTEGYVSLSVNGTVQNNMANIEFTVKDTGIGIPSEVLKSLFNSADEAQETERFSGVSGLGISLCKRIANLMGGSLEAGSFKGLGSEITLSLSLMIAANSGDKDVPQPLLGNVNGPVQKILFVDDIKENYDAVLPYLSTHGLTADYAQSAASAVQLINHSARSGVPYTLIFIDYLMPVSDGLLLTTSLQDAQSQIDYKIVALSSVNDEEIRECFSSQGVADYLTKPLRKSDIDRIFIESPAQRFHQAS